MTDRIVVVGAGGFGRETLDVIEACIGAGDSIEILGVIDSKPREIDLDRLSARRIAYLGTESDWLNEMRGDERYVVAIGSPSVRRAVAERMSETGLSPRTVIHPRAVIGSQSELGAGVVIASGVQVSTNVTLGNHVHLNPGCIIGHDALLHDYVSVNPGAIVSGSVVVGQGALLGAGSMILQGLNVGEGSTVGAAACVTKAVDAGTTVIGVPARKRSADDGF
ncbi:acetyltransferase [Microbacterium aerolatum]|uniref:acetyltransferase n=1 Tax=Microbacterium aerolatum TaxID=153731 RepID=UPI00384FE624